MKRLFFIAFLFLGASIGLQAQDALATKQQKASCKKVCEKKAKGQSASMFTSILEESSKKASCTAKVAQKTNC
ncbi:MAG: hypothetical protein AAF985_27685, partial [Bacteroidota bacterium]